MERACLDKDAHAMRIRYVTSAMRGQSHNKSQRAYSNGVRNWRAAEVAGAECHGAEDRIVLTNCETARGRQFLYRMAATEAM